MRITCRVEGRKENAAYQYLHAVECCNRGRRCARIRVLVLVFPRYQTLFLGALLLIFFVSGHYPAIFACAAYARHICRMLRGLSYCDCRRRTAAAAAALYQPRAAMLRSMVARIRR